MIRVMVSMYVVDPLMKKAMICRKLSFENAAKGAPPLVNEQNKNELSRKRPATEKENGSTSVYESGKIYLSKNIHGIGVKKLRLQNDDDDDDERTDSSETQSSSEAESSIDTIGNQKNETFKVDDYKFRFILLGQRQILLVVHMLLSKITLLENNK